MNPTQPIHTAFFSQGERERVKRENSLKSETTGRKGGGKEKVHTTFFLEAAFSLSPRLRKLNIQSAEEAKVGGGGVEDVGRGGGGDGVGGGGEVVKRKEE